MHKLETWGDDLIFEDFKSIAEKISETNQIPGGKLLFLVLSFCYILEAYLNLPNVSGTKQVELLL